MNFLVDHLRTTAKHYNGDEHRSMIIEKTTFCGIDTSFGRDCFGSQNQINYVHKKHFIDRFCEPAGPIVTKVDIDALLPRLHMVEGDYKKECEYQRYITNDIRGPEQEDPRYKELLSTYEALHYRADFMRKEREIRPFTASSR